MNETDFENSDWIQMAQVKGYYVQGTEFEICKESWLNGVVRGDQQRHLTFMGPYIVIQGVPLDTEPGISLTFKNLASYI
jgi:hypothetical protein